MATPDHESRLPAPVQGAPESGSPNEMGGPGLGVSLEGVRERPLAEMARIALPSVVTMTSYTLMQFIDTLMVSRITPADPVYVAAQGNGGMLVWQVIAAVLGIVTIINTFVSQHLGAGRPEAGPRYAWAGIYMSAAFGLLMFPFALAMPAIFGAYGHEGQLLELEVEYGQIVAIGGGVVLAGRALHHYFFGLHRPGVVMVSAIIGNVVNIVINYALIFGHFGMPEMGVAGAAVGTVIGGVFELGIPMLVFLGPKMNRELRTRAAARCGWAPFRDIIRLGWPGGLMMANEMFCWGYLMTNLLVRAGEAAGEDGGVHNAAGWIALRYMHMSFMPAVGMSIAVTAMIGKCMGMGRPDLAAKRAWLGLGITVAYMGAMAVVFVVFREPLVRLFVPAETSPELIDEIVRVGALVMIAAAVFQIFDAIAIVMSAALRGAGDTVWPGLVTVGLSWGCLVLGGHAMIAIVPHWGSVGPWIGAAAFIIILGVVLLVRFMIGDWRKIDVVGWAEAGVSPVAPDSPVLEHAPDGR